jgi:hypothetical protein
MLHLIFAHNMFVHIISDYAKGPNTSMASPIEATIDEDTIHQVTNPMEIDEASKKKHSHNQY